MQFNPAMIERLHSAQHVVVFSGAGVSQESGIPTFRDARTGLWKNVNPKDLSTVAAFKRQPDQVWGWYEWLRRTVLAAQPNPAHMAIAAMARCVPQLTVITQNVDDLHERAGSEGVLHLHGSLNQPRCSACGQAHILPAEVPGAANDGAHIMPPLCLNCGGWVRPGVVWFGELLTRETWQQARAATQICDLMFSIGTSSDVHPAADLPFEAAKRGACVIQVNPTTTALDAVASYKLRGKAGEVMPALLDATWGARAA